jgi:hypothetical protein
MLELSVEALRRLGYAMIGTGFGLVLLLYIVFPL